MKGRILARVRDAIQARRWECPDLHRVYPSIRRKSFEALMDGEEDQFSIRFACAVAKAVGIDPWESAAPVALPVPAPLPTIQYVQVAMSPRPSRRVSTWAVKAEREAGSIGGGSVTVTALVAGQKVKVRCDVAFDERSRIADLMEISLPSILGGEPVRIRAVPFAHTAVDKIQAMLRHGPKSHRLRDHHDLFVMLSRGHACLDEIAAALPASLAAFAIPMPNDADGIPALAEAYVEPRARAWEAEKASRRFAVETRRGWS